MKIITLNPTEFDQYANTHRYRNYYQSSMYGEAMQNLGYNIHYLGFQDDFGTLIGAGLVIYENVFLGHKYAYCPRGFLFDYSNPVLLKELVDKLKRLLGKQGFIYLKTDPYIPYSVRNEKGEIINYNSSATDIATNLKEAGFRFNGLTKFFENEKARWEAITPLQNSSNELLKLFDKTTRNKINKAIKSGIEIIKSKNKLEDIEQFYEFVKRKHTRPINYYKEIINSFDKKGAIDIYFAKLNTEKFVINSKTLYEETLNINDQLNYQIQNPSKSNMDIQKVINKKMESDKLLNGYKQDLIFATKLLKEHPNGLYIGGNIIIKYDNAVHLLIEGFNPKYKDQNPNYLLKWHIIDEYSKQGYKYFNLNAITGEFEKKNKYSGLNEMKLGFNAKATEYIGEFDLVINPIAYNLYKGVKKRKKNS